MHAHTALALYALALSLVPDETVAAELFIKSRNETELRRLAERWRKAHGLPAPSADATLPVLDPNQQEMALHLARRAQRRRQFGWLLPGMVGLLLLLAFVLWPRLSLLVEPTGMAASEMFAGTPLVRSSMVEGRRLSVYRAEAVPGAVTVWWELTGSGAGELAPSIQERLFLTDAELVVVSELFVHRKDRLLGQAQFRTLNPNEQVALTLEYGTGRRLSAFFAPTFLEQDPAARTYEVSQQLANYNEAVLVEAVRVGPHATTVKLRFPTSGLIQYPTVLADGQPLKSGGVWGATREPYVYEIVLEPVPAGTEVLRIFFGSQPSYIWEEQYIPLPDPAFFTEWHETEERIEAIFAMVTPGSGEFLGAIAMDRKGRPVAAQISRLPNHRWLAVIELQVLDWQPARQEWERGEQITAADLAGIYLAVPRPASPVEVHLGSP